MASISVEFNIKEVTDYLTDLEKKQVPFATSRAINDVLFEARKEEMVQIPNFIDRPNPFTKRAFKVEKSHKKQKVINGSLIIKPIQWDYLQHQVKGGVRRERMITVPVEQKVNKYGNIPGLKRKKPIWRRGQGVTRGTFVGTLKGTYGVWGRVGRDKLRLLVAFINEARYKKILPFKEIAKKVVDKRFDDLFDKHIIRAIKTAKR